MSMSAGISLNDTIFKTDLTDFNDELTYVDFSAYAFPFISLMTKFFLSKRSSSINREDEVLFLNFFQY